MTTYVEKVIPGGAAGEFVVLFGLLPLPLGAESVYTEPLVPGVIYDECQIPTTISTECPVPSTAYTEKQV